MFCTVGVIGFCASINKATMFAFCGAFHALATIDFPSLFCGLKIPGVSIKAISVFSWIAIPVIRVRVVWTL